MRSFLLSLAIVLGGCMATRSDETAGLDPSCVNECEQRSAQCQAGCPEVAAAGLACIMKICNPARNTCLKACPASSSLHP
jgi:hypothetical protein